jgi:pyruvate/2-oxoacid:ferredoxin oxidoreductase alpha subunit
MAKGAVEALRQQGVKAGLFRPLTVWPFPIQQLLPVLARVDRLVVVEASPGQLENELRLAASLAGVTRLPKLDSVRHMGGILPQQHEIMAAATPRQEVLQEVHV